MPSLVSEQLACALIRQEIPPLTETSSEMSEEGTFNSLARLSTKKVALPIALMKSLKKALLVLKLPLQTTLQLVAHTLVSLLQPTTVMLLAQIASKITLLTLLVVMVLMFIQLSPRHLKVRAWKSLTSLHTRLLSLAWSQLRRPFTTRQAISLALTLRKVFPLEQVTRRLKKFRSQSKTPSSTVSLRLMTAQPLRPATANPNLLSCHSKT